MLTDRHPGTAAVPPIAMGRAEFDRHAELEDEHWWFRGRRRILLERLRQWLPRDAGKRVLEIGCGTGGNLRALRAGYAASGIELDEYAARMARARTGCDVLIGDPRNVARGILAQQDAVVLADVLEHIPDDRAFLAAVVGLLKPGALLLISVPADPKLWSPHDEALGHYRRYTAATLRDLWRGLPVDALFQSAFMTLLYPAVRAVRRMRRGSGGTSSDLAAVPAAANALLYGIFLAEAWLLQHNLHFARGCSLLTVLRVGRRD